MRRVARAPVAAALEHRSKRDCVDHAEVDVERRARRDRGEVSEQLLPSGTSVVGRDRLRNEALPERQPGGARAAAVEDGVRRTLEHVAVVRRQVAHPGVEPDDLVGVVRLAELDVTEALTAAGIPEDDLEVERRSLRPPRTGRGPEGEDPCRRGGQGRKGE